MADYVPDVGDIVWLQFDPQAGPKKAGYEQAGHRPALVLSPARYNRQRGMVICCPMSSRIKGYVFEVVISTTPPSVVLTDQIKSLDWRARGATFKGKIDVATLTLVKGKLNALLALS
jgi:mRNA interferase MazF